MEKIYLSEEEKNLFIPIVTKGTGSNYGENDFQWLYLLKQKGLIDTHSAEGGQVYAAYRTDFAIAYIAFNPKLKNPSIWDDKKFIISTVIAVATLIILTITLILDINKA